MLAYLIRLNITSKLHFSSRWVATGDPKKTSLLHIWSQLILKMHTSHALEGLLQPAETPSNDQFNSGPRAATGKNNFLPSLSSFHLLRFFCNPYEDAICSDIFFMRDVVTPNEVINLHVVTKLTIFFSFTSDGDDKADDHHSILSTTYTRCKNICKLYFYTIILYM